MVLSMMLGWLLHISKGEQDWIWKGQYASKCPTKKPSKAGPVESSVTMDKGMLVGAACFKIVKTAAGLTVDNVVDKQVIDHPDSRLLFCMFNCCFKQQSSKLYN